MRLVVTSSGAECGKGELEEGGQKVQTSSCEISKFQGCDVQRDDSS